MARYIDLDKALEILENSLNYSKTQLQGTHEEFRKGCIAAIKDDISNISHMTEADVVPRSEVEDLQKQLGDYKKFVGELRVTHDNHAVIIVGENVEYVEKRVADCFKNIAIKKSHKRLKVGKR